ncbi:MAG: hypothetical protein KC656_15625 [Myxococcales bacterium]|nr:hypothetical protein [Myxococcales bacterium]MCA9569278.1 hypothetical protein [Myxococcales bacterium]
MRGLRPPVAVPAADVVGRFRHRLRGIVPAADLDDAQRVLAAVEDVPWWTVLETRLLGEAARTDLLLGVLRDPGASALAHGPIEGARTFARTWTDDQHPASGCNVLWLEWDAPVGPREPLLLFGVDQGFWPQHGRAPDPLSADARIAALRRCCGAPEDAARRSALTSFVAHLPPGSRLVCAAWLGVRGLDVDRLFVGMPAYRVGSWLARTGWPGDRARAESWLDRIAAPWEEAWLQLEVGADGLLPYLAIETPQSARAPGGHREASFLSSLVEQGARPEHVAALVDWRGRRRRGAVVQHRSFHVKVVLRPDQEPVAKGYFGLHHTAA